MDVEIFWKYWWSCQTERTFRCIFWCAKCSWKMDIFHWKWWKLCWLQTFQTETPLVTAEVHLRHGHRHGQCKAGYLAVENHTDHTCPYCWWFRNPKAKHLGCKQTLQIMGWTTYQVVIAGFLPSTVLQCKAHVVCSHTFHAPYSNERFNLCDNLLQYWRRHKS